ncbi:MAG: D-aminoacyl-tRNA deacylase [Duodenibacillus sp.]|nr:D-aminoacyl-tRNA deacylase [Duodenibacillus sp.]
MIALLQRVSSASVTVEEQCIGRIGAGLMVLVCAVREDTEQKARELAQKLMRYRVFTDDAGKMNLSVREIGGALLLVSQFTLAADTRSGNRPSFSPAAPPDLGRACYEAFVDECRRSGLEVQTGQFGAHMQVALVNDGPVTIRLEN